MATAAKPNKLTKAVPIARGALSVSKDVSIHRLDEMTTALEGMVPNILKLEAAAGRAKVETEDHFNKGSLLVTLIDQEAAQVEALRSAVYQPVWDYGKLIQATFKPYSDRLATIKRNVNALMTTWYKAEEVRKKAAADAALKKQQDEAQAIAEKHEAAGNTEVAAAVLDAALNAPVVRAPAVTFKVNAAGGKTVAKRSWKGVVGNREDILRAIIDGKLPWVIIEFKAGEMNTVARQAAAEGMFHGIKVTHELDLQQRGG